MVNELAILHPVKGKKTPWRERYSRLHKLRFHIEIHVVNMGAAQISVLLQTKQLYKQHLVERFYLKHPDPVKSIFPFPNYTREPDEYFINLINDKYETSLGLCSLLLNYSS